MELRGASSRIVTWHADGPGAARRVSLSAWGVCVCYGSTGQRTRTGHACGNAQTTQTVPRAIVYFS
eukprot:4241012-Prymnesium_polylepis.1